MIQKNISFFGYSTIGFSDRDIESALDAIAASGFKHAEILGQEPHVAVPPRGKELSDFKKRLESRALNVNVHAPLRKNVIGAPEEEWRREAVKVLSDYLCFAGEIEAKELIVHPVPNPIFVSKANDFNAPLRMRDAACRSLDELVPIAQGVKVRILLENLPYLCNYPLLTMKELYPFIKSYPPESVGLVIDTGHAKVRQDDPSEEIRIAGDRLYGTHLHDTDEKGTNDYHWIPTHGALDWNSILSAFVEVKYTGILTFEAANGRFGENPEEIARICHKVGTSWITTFEQEL